jgi:hypothetical protein
MSKYSEILEQADLFCFAVVSKVFGPYKRESDGRQIVIIRDESGNTRTVSYPKYLMEQHLNRVLDPDKHTVDHWDSNKDNNDISNLRIMPRDEHSREDTRRVKLVKFKCKLCDKEFERSPRLIRDKAKKNKAGPFCSRPCAGRYSRKLQLKLIDKLGPQPMVDSEYYKKKYASSYVDVENLFIDYFCDIWEE